MKGRAVWGLVCIYVNVYSFEESGLEEKFPNLLLKANNDSFTNDSPKNKFNIHFMGGGK